MSASEFYYACRNGDAAKVKSLLTLMSPTEIDYMEPNGSTALHAAAYFGHIEIVRVLLDKGASPNQKNKYDKTPEEEAKTSDIAQIIHDFKVKLASNWSISNPLIATSQHRRFYSFNQDPPTLSDVVDKLLSSKELWLVELQGNNGMDELKTCFYKAVENNDAAHLLVAYTLVSPFHAILNKTLANHNELTDEERENPPWFCAYARFLNSDERTLRPYRWTGTTYRGMSVYKDQLAKWKVGEMLMNKNFLSTSKSRNFAEIFANGNVGKDERGVIFTCVVEDDRAALDTSLISPYEAEKEVIVLPCMAFEITKLNADNTKPLAEITLLLR
jgi:hypothetical protein